MKSLILIPLIFLSSCVWNYLDSTTDTRIATLEAEIKRLDHEVASLKSNPQQKPKTDTEPVSIIDGMTTEEAPDEACLKKARDAFFEAGNKQCQQAGNTDEDIKNGKCKIPESVIRALDEKKTQDELLCSTIR